MKTIRRTRIKVKTRELVIVKNETLPVCPVCHSPLRPTGAADGEEAAPTTADEKRPALPAAAKDGPEKPENIKNLSIETGENKK